MNKTVMTKNLFQLENVLSTSHFWSKLTQLLFWFGAILLLLIIFVAKEFIPLPVESQGILMLGLLGIGFITFCAFCLSLFLLVILVIFEHKSSKELNKKVPKYKKKKTFMYSLFIIFYLLILILLVKVKTPSLSKGDPILDRDIPTDTVMFQEITPITNSSVEEAINKYRLENKMSELAIHEPLCDLAKVRVYEIKSDWSHSGFESRADGVLYDRFCKQGNIQCTSLGENLAMDYYDLASLMQGWINSSGHKENLLGDYNAQCVAVDGNYIASIFAKVDRIESPSKSNTTNNGQNSSNQVKVAYNLGLIQDWENGRESDRKALDSWGDSDESDWYDPKETAKIVRGIKEKVDIANKIIDGITNSKITYEEYDQLTQRYNDLSQEITKTRRDIFDKAYDKCREDYSELSEVTGKDYSDKCKGYLE